MVRKKMILVILLFVVSASCRQNKVPDYIRSEGKAYVVGSGKPPRGKSLKIYVYQAIKSNNTDVWQLKDSFYTDNAGHYTHLFYPAGKTDRYKISPAVIAGYDCPDWLVTAENGNYYKDFRFSTSSMLRLRFLNVHYTEGDSLVVSDPESTMSIYAPWPVDVVYTFVFTAYEPIRFSYRLRRKGNWSAWNETYYLYEDSTHYYEVIY